MMKEIIEKEKTPPFGHFEIISVGNFSYESAREFMLKNMPAVNELTPK